MDDIDEDELALAMSTELPRENRTLSERRTRSFSSLDDFEANLRLYVASLIFRNNYIDPFSDQHGMMENFR